MSDIPVRVLRKIAERFAAQVFVAGDGTKATRLILADESAGKPGRDLGGLCEEAMRDRLFRLLCDEFSR